MGEPFPPQGGGADADDSTLQDAPAGRGGQDVSTAAVQVCVRFRPLLETEILSGATSSRLRWDEEARLVRACKHEGAGPEAGGHAERTFEFDHVFGPDAAQEEVFERAGLSRLLDRVVEGFHATVFAYGQTGSGKTHTMEGFEYLTNKAGKGQPRAQMQNVSPDRLGLVPRAINGLFSKVEQCQLTSADVFTVRLSFLQIYNERVFDLLNPGHMAVAASAGGAAAGGLRLRWNVRDAAVMVENLFVFECRTGAEALEYYRTGIRNRAVSSHQMNQASSRSHCVLTLAVERAAASARSAPLAATDDLRIAKLTLVDLAGSERQGETGAAGKTLRESVSINQSLFVLRKVITALAKRRSSQELALVPYRESKLTTLLRDAIGGSSYTLMIACTSSNDAHYEETLSTLHYAMTTGRIKNRPAVNLDPKSAVIRQLRIQVRSLRQKLAATQAYAVRVTGRPLPPELGANAGDSSDVPVPSVAGQPAPALPPEEYRAVAGVLAPSAPQAWEASSVQLPHQQQLHPAAPPFGASAPPVPSPPPMMPGAGAGSGQLPPPPRQPLHQSHGGAALPLLLGGPSVGPSPPQIGVPAVSHARAASPSGEAQSLGWPQSGHEDAGDEHDEWSRLSKPALASRLMEAVKALHAVAAENFMLRRDREELEEETMMLRRRIEEQELLASATAEPDEAMLSWHRHRDSAPTVPWPTSHGLPMALWEIGGGSHVHPHSAYVMGVPVAVQGVR